MAAARHIRDLVFCQEQGVSADVEWDDHDEASEHFLLYDGESAIACARVRPYGPGTFKIERVAVLKEHRGSGIGAAIMEAIMVHLGAATLALNAQTAVERFYSRLGFVSEGAVFQEAGIDHIKMVKRSR
jgi:predicted GNAT family N-acyltransferase